MSKGICKAFVVLLALLAGGLSLPAQNAPAAPGAGQGKGAKAAQEKKD